LIPVAEAALLKSSQEAERERERERREREEREAGRGLIRHSITVTY
jgi:hypothetical protein